MPPTDFALVAPVAAAVALALAACLYASVKARPKTAAPVKMTFTNNLWAIWDWRNGGD